MSNSGPVLAVPRTGTVRGEKLPIYVSVPDSPTVQDAMEAHLRPVPTPGADEARRVDPQVFEDFYLATYRRLFTALCLVTGNRDEAQEVMQDAYLRMFERWDRLGSLADPQAYLFRVAMNIFRNRYRRARLAMQRTLSLRPSDDLAMVETRDEVVRLLRTLAPRERAAIVLTTILDLPAEEAGRLLGIKASTVRTLATRARVHMKDQVVDG